jgi:hypothetical protein
MIEVIQVLRAQQLPCVRTLPKLSEGQKKHKLLGYTQVRLLLGQPEPDASLLDARQLQDPVSWTCRPLGALRCMQ